MRVLPPLSIVASLVLLVAQPVWAQSDPDPRELEARTSFARGDYDQALSLYVGLYAETLHPTYLRNIGRCYQQLRQPGRAIDSFREYLRKARDLPPEKRAEIDGFIAEMEALQRQQAATAPAPAPGAALPSALSASPPAAAPGLAVAAAPERGRPLHARWWFWAGVGTLAAIAAVTVAVAASGGGASDGKIGVLDLRPGGR
jgi:hypothetical protein